MKVLKLGINGISKNLWLNLFMFIQITVIVVAVNVMVANMNSRNILLQPFSYLQGKTGVMFNKFDADPDDDSMVLLKKIEKKLKGNFTTHRIYDGGFPDPKSVKYVEVIGMETEFYKNINIPLAEGSWDLLSDSGNYVECVITQNTSGYGLGSIIKVHSDYVEDVTYKVVGVLSNPTYIIKSSCTSENCCNGFFESYDYNEPNTNIFMYVNGDKLKQYSGQKPMVGEIITYDNGISKSNYLKNNGVLGRTADYVTLGKFFAKSEDYVKSLQKRVLPIFIGAFIVMSIGIISASVIQMMNQMREYGVCYLCGATWLQCVVLSISSNIVTYFSSFIVSALAMFMINMSRFKINYGFLYMKNNLLVTLGIFAVLLLVSVISPLIVLKTSNIRKLILNS